MEHTELWPNYYDSTLKLYLLWWYRTFGLFSTTLNFYLLAMNFDLLVTLSTDVLNFYYSLWQYSSNPLACQSTSTLRSWQARERAATMEHTVRRCSPGYAHTLYSHSCRYHATSTTSMHAPKMAATPTLLHTSFAESWFWSDNYKIVILL